MARLKGKDDVITGELDPKYWVQKADPLVLMRGVPFSLGELKMLDTYISRINAADDTLRTVIFTKEEYEELMGLTSANYRALAKNAEGLLGKVVTLEMPDKAFYKFVLFTKAHYHKDDYGKPVIEITCSEDAKDLFFCIGKYHYFSYELKNVIKLTRKSSYLLYVYIQQNRFRKNWEIDLATLRDNVLDCKGQESYQEYKIFKNRVLDPAVKEVNEKTDCHFSYEAVKRGRTVVAIKFIYTSQELADENDVPEQLSLPFMTSETSEHKGDNVGLDDDFFSAACNDEFSPEQVEQIRQVLLTIPAGKLPPDNVAGGISIQRYHYLAERYAAMNRYSPKKNRLNYLIKMLKDDAKEI